MRYTSFFVIKHPWQRVGFFPRRKQAHQDRSCDLHRVNQVDMEGTAVESTRSALPSTRFKGPCNWMTYETFKNCPVWFGSLLCLFLVGGQAVIISSTLPLLIKFGIGAWLSCIALSSMVLCLFMKRRNVSQNRATLAQVVLALDPGLDGGKWDEVACEINWLLYKERCWKTCCFFYNGDACSSFFRDFVVKPFYLGELDEDLAGDGKPIIRDAMTSYQRGINEWFEHLQRDGPPEELSLAYSGLPRDQRFAHIKFKKSFFSSKTSRLNFLLMANRVIVAIFCKTDPLHVLMASSCIAQILWSYKTHGNERYVKLGVKSAVKLLATVIHVAPGRDMDKWDHIARHMNQYLHGAGVWERPVDNFFDGNDCLAFFERAFPAEPLKKRSCVFPELGDLADEALRVI